MNKCPRAFGLGIGVEILAVNGVSLADKDESEPGKLKKGQAGTALTLDVLQVGKTQNTQIRLNRETVQIKNVVYAGIIRPGIGYVSLEEFNASAANKTTGNSRARACNITHNCVVENCNSFDGWALTIASWNIVTVLIVEPRWQ